MSGIFKTIDKIKPACNVACRFVMFICRILLIVDILITTMAVAGRYILFTPDPVRSEEMVLICMSYMAVLSTVLVVRRGAYIHMTALDSYLSKGLVGSLDILADLAVLILSVVMIMVGWKYVTGTDSKGTYVNMPNVSRFWICFPVPPAGVAILIFELEVLYNHVRSFLVKEET